MIKAIQYIAWVVGLGLNLLVISALLRGSYREYRLVFVYSIALLLTTVVEIASPPEVRALYYWINESFLQVLVFCVVIAFIDRAAHNAKKQPIKRRWLITGAALILIASYLVHRGPRLNLQMTLISRDLNISAVILDLILWSLLVASRRPDRRLLLLSGGLGVQLTGAIMGQSLRQLSHSTDFPGALLEVITGLLALYIWWRALRPVPPPHSKESPA